MHENYISNQNHLVYGSSLFCDSSTFRFVHISPSAPMIISGSSLFCDSSTFRFVHISPSALMIISGTITLVTVFQFIEIL
ncbi:hypothetical protein T08_2275 [Trichinella sp. T8]|nr:hypothetical protein T08_2275 [Trichinella sp. T8]